MSLKRLFSAKRRSSVVDYGTSPQDPHCRVAADRYRVAQKRYDRLRNPINQLDMREARDEWERRCFKSSAKKGGRRATRRRNKTRRRRRKTVKKRRRPSYGRF